MILIFGGAYQGKLEYAKTKLGKPDARVFDCRVCLGDLGSPAKNDKMLSEGCEAPGSPAEIGETRPAAEVSEAQSAKDAPVLPDFSADIINGLENFTWECCTEDPARRREATDEMRAHRAEWLGSESGKDTVAPNDRTGKKDLPDAPGKILIITDVSQGIVPMDARTRAFREMNGRLMMYLASEAEEVYRVFCGIGKRIR